MFQPSVFSQLVKLIDRGVFARLVSAHGTDRYGKSFKSWQHMMAMLYCQLSGASSLREAEAMYATRDKVGYHLHLPRLRRSTLSQANNARSPLLFKALAEHLIGLHGAKHTKHSPAALLTVLGSGLFTRQPEQDGCGECDG